MPIWHRVQKDGAIIYRPDPAHPVFADFSAQLPAELQPAFASLVGLIGSSVPIASLHSDFAGSAEDIVADEADIEAIRQMAEAMVPRLLAQDTDRERVLDILRQVDPFRSAWSAAQPVIENVIKAETIDE